MGNETMRLARQRRGRYLLNEVGGVDLDFTAALDDGDRLVLRLLFVRHLGGDEHRDQITGREAALVGLRRRQRRMATTRT
jgi:hypothetical protein